jgi:putative DNA primase/helicase
VQQPNTAPKGFRPYVANGETDAQAWSLPDSLVVQQDREPYPLEALPEPIRQAVEEVQLFVQAPVEMVGASALTALSVAIQSLADVRRFGKLCGPTSLFFLSIAESGERKTSIDRYFLDPIRDFERAQREAAKGDEASYSADLTEWQARYDAKEGHLSNETKAGNPVETIKADLANLTLAKPSQPRVPRLVYTDTTQEKLTRNLATVWPAAGIVSSEGGAVLGGHAMGPDTVMRTLSAFNVLWDGGQLNVDRQTTESYVVQGARLTIGIQAQPGVLAEFMRAGRGLSRGSGFLARFLFCCPISTQGTRAFREATNGAAVDAFNARISALLNEPLNIDPERGLSPNVLDLSAEAFAKWRIYHDTIEHELGMDGEFIDVRDIAAKAADNIARLAGLFHVFEHGPAGLIGPEHIESAARLVLWHTYESRNYLGAFAMPETDARAAALDQWLLAYCQRNGVAEVPTREVLRCGPNKLRDKVELRKALATLAEHNRAREVENGRRRSIVVNPALLKGGPS